VPTDTRPNFFIVGAQKSGTSGLSAWLARHPQVFMSFPKEPGYLAFLERGYPYTDGYGRRSPPSEYVVTDQSKYVGLFAAAKPLQTVRGEASTWYFHIPGVAERIRRFSEDARILVILRNPADRAYSAWCHARRDGLEPCDHFAQALEMEEARGEVEFLLRYRRMGMYSDSLAEYRAVFDSARLLVLFYEELLGEPTSLWRRLCSFLDIDEAGAVPKRRRPNRSGQPRSRLAQSILGSHRLKSVALSILPDSAAFWIKEQLDEITLARFPAMDQAIRDRLRDYYREDIERLASMTGRDLSDWLR
jgi:hypothetical protein